jgi:hypothetical protein
VLKIAKFTPQRQLCRLQQPSGALEFTAEPPERQEDLDRAHRQHDEAREGHADGRYNPLHTCNRSESRPAETATGDDHSAAA